MKRKALHAAAIGVLAATSALSTGGYLNERAKSRGISLQLSEARKERNRLSRAAMDKVIQDLSDPVIFDRIMERAFNIPSKRAQLEKAVKDISDQVPHHEKETDAIIQSLRGVKRFSPRDRIMLKLGRTIGALDVIAGPIEVTDSLLHLRVEDSREKLRRELTRRGHR